jgi:hypothetical protein
VTSAGPAFTAGAVIIVKVLVEVSEVHGAVPVAVKVSITLPAALSAALGV